MKPLTGRIAWEIAEAGRGWLALPCREVIIDNLHVAIRSSGATILRGELPTLNEDSVRLAQLFQNLISNAIKFQPAHPPVVHVQAVEIPDKRSWHFSVRDNGIGIPKEYHDQIFVLFQRLHTRDEYPGSGIGLATCKRIVDSMGGRIWVESEPGVGSVFHFTLPVRSALPRE